MPQQFTVGRACCGYLLVALVCLLSAHAQTAQPLIAENDPSLTIAVEFPSHQFHLGALIPLALAYTAKTPGEYFWVSNSNRLAGGRKLEIVCSAPAEKVTSAWETNQTRTFEWILIAPCGGVGSGGGSGCADCGGEVPLSDKPVRIPVNLNQFVRFRSPGTYTCEASAADVTSARPEDKVWPALLVKSNSISLDVVEDPEWSKATLQYSEAVYDHNCQREDSATARLPLECFQAAQRMVYLDTLDSLAAIVNRFDGRNHGWETGFWEAIQTSSHPADAVKMMAKRIQVPSFQVSRAILEWLASSELNLEAPDAFQGGAPEDYHSQAVEKLRKYVRLLGESLPKKDSDALPDSLNIYREISETTYCEKEPLIPPAEQTATLESVHAQ